MMELEHKSKIAAFPAYTFLSDGSVWSSLTKRILKPTRMGQYVGLQLRYAEGGSRKRYLHRLVAEAFHGPCPEGMQCRHLDGDRMNNSAANLCWGTASENNRDKERHGTGGNGERNSMAVLCNNDVAAMRALRTATGKSYRLISEDFGVSTMTAFRAVTGQSWSNQ